MKLPLYQVDAFTGRVFTGNPAAVVLLEEPLPGETMQKIAIENNLSETAFVIPRGEAYPLRWFTPALEIDLCGHATLATAFVLFNERLAGTDEVRFDTKSGRLSVRQDGDLLKMDFPSRPPEPVEVSDLLVEALGTRPREAHLARDILALFDTPDEVAALAPKFHRFAELGAFAVMATARGSDVDFVSRFFAPRAGVNEDPVTGSAHCTLVPFWAARLGKRVLHARQISRRGGELFCEDRGDRVTLGGRAVEYLRGEITI